MDPQFIAFSIVILLFSVIVHEVMHGYVALKFGDHTAERAGRLTLNPLPHIDPIGTILVPGFLLFLGSPFLIGWAKPVPVNPLNFNQLRKGELYVSLAGILSNLALALAATLLFHLTLNSMPDFTLAASLLRFAVIINLTLAIFNLIPIPPLDGANALLSQLPLELARQYERYAQFGPFLILILLYLGVLGTILRAILNPLLQILGIY